MFLRRYFNTSFVVICLIVLGVGFLAGYAGSLLVRGNQMANGTETTPMHTCQLCSPSADLTIPTPMITQGVDERPASAGTDVVQTPAPDDEKIVLKYIVKEYMGKVAVYKMISNGETTLASVIDIDVNYLPESDKKKLKEGIVVNQEEDMLQLLEDYMS